MKLSFAHTHTHIHTRTYTYINFHECYAQSKMVGLIERSIIIGESRIE